MMQPDDTAVANSEAAQASEILRELEERIGARTFNLWVRDNASLEIKQDHVTVNVHNKFLLSWLTAWPCGSESHFCLPRKSKKRPRPCDPPTRNGRLPRNRRSSPGNTSRAAGQPRRNAMRSSQLRLRQFRSPRSRSLVRINVRRNPRGIYKLLRWRAPAEKGTRRARRVLRQRIAASIRRPPWRARAERLLLPIAARREETRAGRPLRCLPRDGALPT